MTRRQGLIIALCALVAAVATAAYFAYEQREPDFNTGALTEYYSKLTVREVQPVDAEAVRAASSLQSVPQAQHPAIRPVRVPGQHEPAGDGETFVQHVASCRCDLCPGPREYSRTGPGAVAVMERSTKFMRECCIAEIKGKQMVGMWEPATLTHGSGPPTYKLGGAGVALAALSSAEVVSPESVSFRRWKAWHALETT